MNKQLAVMLCISAAASFADEAYTNEQLAKMKAATDIYAAAINAIAASIDTNQVAPVEEHKVFTDVQFTLMKALPRALQLLGHPGLYTGTGGYWAVDAGCIREGQDGIARLVIIRRRNPNTGQLGGLALPGGFITTETPPSDVDNAEKSAERELAEETGINEVTKPIPIAVRASGTRDPRKNVATILYLFFTKQKPQITPEAAEVYEMTSAEVEAAKDWFADHKDLARTVFAKYEELKAQRKNASIS